MSKLYVISKTEYYESGIGSDEVTTLVAAFTDESKADAYMVERKEQSHTFYDKTELTVDA